MNNNTKSTRLLFVCGLIGGIAAIGLGSPDALAWKPTTHVFLAEQALSDALADGKITIPQVDYSTGEIIGEVGEYAVDPVTLSALQSYPAQYRSGLLGPDAYPDILTGQQVIHPAPDLTGIAGGSNAWLQEIWQQARLDNSPAVKAFTLGFLTHAAGDMYGHTFVNNFSGGPFEILPPTGPQNAIKHVVLEGYVDKRLNRQDFSPGFYNASISGVEDFIYRTMIDAKPGTTLSQRLLVDGADGTDYSVPRIYSTLRANLQQEIDDYYETKADYDRRYSEYIEEGNDCAPLDLSCSRTRLYAQAAGVQAAKLAYVSTNGIQTTYKEAWRADIDAGLRRWPDTSHEVAKALFFSPNSPDIQRAEDILTDYSLNHLLSMSGSPDFVGMTASLISDVVEAITPDFLLDPIRQLKEDMLNALLIEAIGMNKEQLKAYMTSPDIHFDPVMTAGQGERVTLQRFNADYLNIADSGYDNPNESFDYRQMPAAYNTVVMSKLIMLSPSEINRLLSDLGANNSLSTENAMLGFIETLDGDNQWVSPIKMSLAENCSAYRTIFMRQAGEKTGCMAGRNELTPTDRRSIPPQQVPLQRRPSQVPPQQIPPSQVPPRGKPRRSL